MTESELSFFEYISCNASRGALVLILGLPAVVGAFTLPFTAPKTKLWFFIVIYAGFKRVRLAFGDTETLLNGD